MKKVTAFIGSQQKHATYNAVCEFEKNLKSYGEVDFECVFLKDYRLEFCRGCKVCTVRGEEYCPLKDDRDALIEKIAGSDGVIFATPNYSFHVSAAMKNMLDRLSFIFHRPRFFGKAFTSIVTQGFFGGRSIAKYLRNMGQNFGFTPVEGCVLQTLEPTTEAIQQKNRQKIQKAAARYHRVLMRSRLPTPSLFRLMMFRMSRASLKAMLNADYCDYRHYEAKGWFKSDYYYDAPMGPVKKLAGLLFDLIGRQMSKQS